MPSVTPSIAPSVAPAADPGPTADPVEATDRARAVYTYTPPVARFHNDLDYSFDTLARARFDAAYRQAFGEGTHIEVVNDLALQRRGIDAWLTLPHAVPGPDGAPLSAGTRLAVDEKIRRLPLVKSKPWDDVLIEEYSDYDHQVPGWLGPEKRHDVVAYAGPDPRGDGSWRVLLYWSRPLRRLAARSWQEWLRRYGRKFARNEAGYKTSFRTSFRTS